MFFCDRHKAFVVRGRACDQQRAEPASLALVGDEARIAVLARPACDVTRAEDGVPVAVLCDARCEVTVIADPVTVAVAPNTAEVDDPGLVVCAWLSLSTVGVAT